MSLPLTGIKLFVFLQVIVLSGFPVTANDVGALHISIGKIPYVLHEEKPGPHNIIFYTVLLESAAAGSIVSVLPNYRADRDFYSHQSDCLYIAVDDAERYPQGSGPEKISPTKKNYENTIRFSDPINQISLHAFTREGEPILRSFTDLKGKVIIGVRTQLQVIGKTIEDHGGIILYVEDYEKGFKLLDKGRADTVITYSLDVKIMMDNMPEPSAKMNANRYAYDKEFPLKTVSEIAACWRSPESDAFLDRFNQRLVSIRKSGRLADIFSTGE